MARVNWRGVIVDSRTAAMLAEANRLLPSISFWPVQGSYSTGVSASGGTHSGGGAVDITLTNLSDAAARQIETVMRRVGFAAWYRPAIPGTWNRHVHGIAMGCADASSAAKVQMQNYKDGDDGLVGPGRDTGDRRYVKVTWESYVAGLKTPAPPAPKPGRAVVSVTHLLAAIAHDRPAPTGAKSAYFAEVAVVENALHGLGLLAGGLVDGSAGTSSFGAGSAYAAYQHSLGYSGKDADGLPGLTSLTKMSERFGFTAAK